MILQMVNPTIERLKRKVRVKEEEVKEEGPEEGL